MNDSDDEFDVEPDDAPAKRGGPHESRTVGKSIPHHHAAVLSAIEYSHIRGTPGRVPKNYFVGAIVASFYQTYNRPLHEDIAKGVRMAGLGQFDSNTGEYVFVDPSQIPPVAEIGVLVVQPISKKRLERLYRHELARAGKCHPGMLDVEPGKPFPEAIGQPSERFMKGLMGALKNKKKVVPMPRARAPKPPALPDPKLLALAALVADGQGTIIKKEVAIRLVTVVIGNETEAARLLIALDDHDLVYLEDDEVTISTRGMTIGQDFRQLYPDRFLKKS